MIPTHLHLICLLEKDKNVFRNCKYSWKRHLSEILLLKNMLERERLFHKSIFDKQKKFSHTKDTEKFEMHEI